MQTDLTNLVSLSAGDLASQARAILVGQAARIYDPEALTVVEEIIDRNVSIMGDEQLQHIVLRGDQ
jgi:hypothetical protein